MNAPWAPGANELLCESISSQLNDVRDHQKSWRLENEDGRAYAETLNGRLSLLTVFAAVGLALVGVGQTVFLKRLFQTARVVRTGDVAHARNRPFASANPADDEDDLSCSYQYA